MCMHEQWWLHWTSQWGWLMHVYCVAVTLKMTKWVKQWICTKFCIKLEHSSKETIWMIQKATAMGNWWLAVTSQQCARSCITSRAEFFGKGIQPCNMKNKDIYWRRYKIQETLYIRQWFLSPLQSRHRGTSHSSPSHHQLPCRIFLNLIDSLKSLPFQRWV